VGEHEILRPEKAVAEEEEVEVERAGAVPGAAFSARGTLEALEPSEERPGREARPSREHGIDEIGLRRPAHRARPVKG